MAKKAESAKLLAETKEQNEKLKQDITEKLKAKGDGGTLMDISKERTRELPRTNFTVRRILRGHFNKIYDLQWCEQSGLLVSASQDGKLLLWDVQRNLKVQAVNLRCKWVMTCACNESGELLAAGGLDNIVDIYRVGADLSTRAVSGLTGHKAYISCARFLSPRHLLTSSGDANCMQWDVEASRQTATFVSHVSNVLRCELTFEDHDTDVNTVAFFPDGHAFATGCDDDVCRLWDLRACRTVATYSKFMRPDVDRGVQSICFSRSGRLLFVSYADCNVFVWDTLLGQNVGILSEGMHTQRVSCFQLSPDGFAIASGSWDQTIRIWSWSCV